MLPTTSQLPTALATYPHKFAHDLSTGPLHPQTGHRMNSPGNALIVCQIVCCVLFGCQTAGSAGCCEACGSRYVPQRRQLQLLPLASRRQFEAKQESTPGRPGNQGEVWVPTRALGFCFPGFTCKKSQAATPSFFLELVPFFFRLSLSKHVGGPRKCFP